MIKSFQEKETAKIWSGQHSRRLPQSIQQIARRKLRMLNNARTLDDLRIPTANRLERLKGNRAGQYSICINDQWGSVSFGGKAMPSMWRLWITTENGQK